ncbi:uncharacterized protein LOC120658313 isoform X3 [Panicum virgatum]|uniref:uncharacterized protein LOC120658313 isoform X3 n=1 Tax=Panicum virgatum TaxID=38727 RepID=UPI0019D514DA|nr:uncharacterized protein LOC120658313 isoform X3 [Panicum virgatum]
MSSVSPVPMTENLYLDYFGKEFGSISDYGQDEWSKLNEKVVRNLLNTVVPVASFIGNKMYFGCTGIVVESNEAGASILTSASLVRSDDDDRNMKSILMIQVRLPNGGFEATIGRVAHYDLDYNAAVIIIPSSRCLRAACFDRHMEFGSPSNVVAVGRWFYSGRFMATAGILTDEPNRDYPEHMRISTCKIPMVMTGGPLIDSGGNFVGMNFYSMDRTPLLPSNKIVDFLVLKRVIKSGTEKTLKRKYESRCRSKIDNEGPEVILKSISEKPASLLPSSEGTSSGESESEECVDEEFCFFPDFHEPLPVNEFTELIRNDLKPRGYAIATRLEGGMHLVNTFEEEFVEDTWCKLSKKVASDTSRSVVSLASFKDCIGSTSRILTSASLIRSSPDENNIADNLKIQVYLPNKLVVTGTLQHYNLEYNVAVISVMGFRCLRTAEFHNQVQIEPQREVVTVGRVFESGKLMATSGIVTGKESTLDCKELMVTTCKITKAGIGGPLIDLDGNFLGMNFYGRKETYFLPRNMILGLIKHFEAERSVTRDVIYSKANRWPVPVPRWSYPSSRARRRQKL